MIVHPWIYALSQVPIGHTWIDAQNRVPLPIGHTLVIHWSNIGHTYTRLMHSSESPCPLVIRIVIHHLVSLGLRLDGWNGPLSPGSPLIRPSIYLFFHWTFLSYYLRDRLQNHPSNYWAFDCPFVREADWGCKAVQGSHDRTLGFMFSFSFLLVYFPEHGIGDGQEADWTTWFTLSYWGRIHLNYQDDPHTNFTFTKLQLIFFLLLFDLYG